MSAGLFRPELWKKLEDNPETAELLTDPSFKTILDELRATPSSLSKYITDPRVLKVFTVLSEQSANPAQPSDSMETTVVDDDDADEHTATTNDRDIDFTSSMPTPAASTPPPPVKELTQSELALLEKEKGTNAYKRRDFGTAIECYSKAVDLDADNMSLLTNRAAAKLEHGDMDGCIEDCTKAINENQERNLRTDFKIIARAYGRMGNAYMKKEEYAKAIASFEKSLLESSDMKIKISLKDAERIQKKKEEEAYTNPELSEKVRKEGNDLFLSGNFPESILKYTDAIKRNGKDASPYSNRAAAYMKLGEFPMALKDCDRCLEIDPSFVKAYIRKGNIHFFMKEYHKCLTVYEKGLKLAPNHKELKQGLMKTNMKIQQVQNSGEVDEAQVQQAMQDPEIQQIMHDPQMQNLLKQMQEDPKFAAQAMNDPSVAAKVQKLMASGVLRVG